MTKKTQYIQDYAWSNPWDIVFDNVLRSMARDQRPHHCDGTPVSSLIKEEVFRRVKNTMVLNIRDAAEDRIEHVINALRKKALAP